MTRETKIGLLVGLAFIIVIGILLSDHLTSSTEPPSAPLTVAGPNVRSGVTSPGGPTPPITNAQAATVVQPTGPVPTQNELAHSAPVTLNASGAGNNTPPNAGSLQVDVGP